MGIVNVTPDSFSDGGLYAETEAAVAHGVRLAAEGAAIIDVGGESTRPGSEPVPVDVELARVVPVVERLAAETDALLSIDTTKAAVANAALDAGAGMVNDVTALRGDPDMAALVAERGCPVCLMHMLGEPRTMQVEPVYDDVVAEVCDHLERRLAAALAAGVREEQVLLDPGIGFGKTLRHAQALHRRPARRRARPARDRHRGHHGAWHRQGRRRRARARCAAQRRGAARGPGRARRR